MVLIIGHDEVEQILAGRQDAVLDVVRDAYLAHEAGRSALPHSVFLRFPDGGRNRIIGLPAYAGGTRPAAGMKWIASFPGNLELGLDRASAVIVLNSVRTGRPEVLLEGSLVSARRTAAGAALAARQLAPPDSTGVALIGTGVINFESLRALAAVLPELAEVVVFDLDPARMEAFAARCAVAFPQLKLTPAVSARAALGSHPLICIATTALSPHLELSGCLPGAVVLHLSLRDLTPEAVLGAVNVVDDPDHVLRERTSLHLAEQQSGDRRFVHATLGGLLGGVQLPAPDGRPVVFSPFGLGVLDIALAEYVRAEAEARGLGHRVDGFLPGTRA
jgi:ornithine cyclodeaminase